MPALDPFTMRSPLLPSKGCEVVGGDAVELAADAEVMFEVGAATVATAMADTNATITLIELIFVEILVHVSQWHGLFICRCSEGKNDLYEWRLIATDNGEWMTD